MKMIFFNVGWMKSYQGETDIYGNFSFLKQQKNKKNKLAHDKWNFLPLNEICYAYVPLKWGANNNPPKINIKRIEKKASDHINDIAVIFISKNPFNNITYIVGWYIHATLLRQQQPRPHQKSVNKNIYFAAYAKYSDTICLPENERNFEIPTAQKYGKHKGYGQKPIWYADTDEMINFRKQVENYIINYTLPEVEEDIKTTKTKNIDPEHNKLIELKAIECVTSYYKENGYQVKSVENLNLGFDLIIEKNKKIAYVEVKGNSLSQINIELSPNEYNALKKYYKKYIIASVTNCITENPTLNLFTINQENNNYYIQLMENKNKKFIIQNIIHGKILLNTNKLE